MARAIMCLGGTLLLCALAQAAIDGEFTQDDQETSEERSRDPFLPVSGRHMPQDIRVHRPATPFAAHNTATPPHRATISQPAVHNRPLSLRARFLMGCSRTHASGRRPTRVVLSHAGCAKGCP